MYFIDYQITIIKELLSYSSIIIVYIIVKKNFTEVQDHLYTDYPVVEFLPESINVSDKDGDEIGEITFAYILEDFTGVIPDLKLLILENGDKYIIRGNFAGKKNFDKSLKDGPNEFLNEANRVWKKLNDAHPYSY